jgi:hypothetical protein
MEDERAMLIDRLAETRAELVDVARDLDRDTWTQPVYAHGEANEWSAMDLLRHLAWAEGGMLRLLRQIKAGEEGVPADFDLDAYNATGVQKLKAEMPAELLQRMASNRQELVEFIGMLEEDDWEKQGRHGSLRILTIREICELVASHEAEHLRDMRQRLRLGERPPGATKA